MTKTNAAAVRAFFEMSTPEMRGEWLKLSTDEREWFGGECRQALGEPEPEPLSPKEQLVKDIFAGKV